MAGRGETQPRQERRGARSRAVAADCLKAVMQLGEMFARRMRIGFGLRQRALHGAQFRVAIEHKLECERRHDRRFLGDVRNDPRRRQRHLPSIGIDLAAQQREERGLARAVRADQPDLLAWVNRQRRFFEQALVAPGKREAREADHATAVNE